MSTRESHGVEIHYLNRDEVGIHMLIEKTHDNDYNGVPILKGLDW
jgi:hypothetical protein